MIIGQSSNMTFKMSTTEYFRRRQLQLEQQAHDDHALRQLVPSCPQTVSKYLLLMSRMNRKRTWNTIGASWTQKYRSVQENLDEIDSEHTQLTSVFNNNEYVACQKLAELVKSREN